MINIVVDEDDLRALLKESLLVMALVYREKTNHVSRSPHSQEQVEQVLMRMMMKLNSHGIKADILEVLDYGAKI